MTFTLIGERLTTHRESFQKIVFERDGTAAIREARRQQRAGATHLDFNTGAGGEKEIDEMRWALETVVPALDSATGVVIDTQSIECLSEALTLLAGRRHTIVNAIAYDALQTRETLALAARHQAGVIAIVAGGAAAPRSCDERMNRAVQLQRQMNEAGIPDERQYFDPQLVPLAYDTWQPKAVLETATELRRRFPRAHVLAGLSNVSFQLPNRKLLHRTFLPMLLASGVNGLILDPCDKDLRQTLITARALLGQDEFLTTYLETNA